MASQAQIDRALDKLAAPLLESVPERVGGFVYLRYSERLPLKELWRGGVEGVGTGGDGKRLLAMCEKRQRTVVVHDADKDTQMRGAKVRTFLSALAAPILDENRYLLGVVLMASETVGAFEKEHRYAVERAARDFVPLLAALKSSPAETKGDGSDKATPSSLGVYLYPLGLALLLLVLFAFSPTYRNDPPPVTVVQPVLNEDAKNVAMEFLESLRTEKYEQAWGKLDRGLRAKWSSQDFAARVNEWKDLGDNRTILSERTISRVQRHNRSAQIVLLESSVAGDRGQWTWEMEKVGGDWTMARLEGPVSSPR